MSRLEDFKYLICKPCHGLGLVPDGEGGVEICMACTGAKIVPCDGASKCQLGAICLCSTCYTAFCGAHGVIRKGTRGANDIVGTCERCIDSEAIARA